MLEQVTIRNTLNAGPALMPLKIIARGQTSEIIVTSCHEHTSTFSKHFSKSHASSPMDGLPESFYLDGAQLNSSSRGNFEVVPPWSSVDRIPISNELSS
jgi:hypothetical protein